MQAFVALLAVAAAPCAAQTTDPAAPPHVLESFEVGADVYVRSLAVESGNNTLWVGTSAGVHEIDLASREPRNTFTRDDGLANEYVFAIHVDRQRHKWFGTNAGGVSRYRDGDWRTWFPMHGLADYWVYSFAEQADGTLWIGTWDGVTRVDAATGELSNYVDELVNEWVYGITVDAAQRVWFATEGGVSMYDGERWQAWTHADGLGADNAQGLPPSTNTGLGTRARHDLGVLRGGEATYNPSYVFAIHHGADGRIWAGTWGGGVAYFDGSRWHNLTTADGLAGNIVYSIAGGADGVLWFGTDAGLSRYDGRVFHTYDARGGLVDDHVYAIAVAADEEVWVGTRGGVTRIGR